eukprot:scaffold63339_cov62-Phaeocystis_antarctica.AAC.1
MPREVRFAPCGHAVSCHRSCFCVPPRGGRALTVHCALRRPAPRARRAYRFQKLQRHSRPLKTHAFNYLSFYTLLAGRRVGHPDSACTRGRHRARAPRVRAVQRAVRQAGLVEGRLLLGRELAHLAWVRVRARARARARAKVRTRVMVRVKI